MKQNPMSRSAVRCLTVLLVTVLTVCLVAFGAIAEETEPLATFSEYSLTLSENIDVNMFVPAEDGVTPTVAFSFRGETGEPTEGTLEDGKWCFTFEGITPQYLDESIRATLYVDGIEQDVETVCVADYLATCAGKSHGATAAALSAYGAAAKWYRGMTDEPTLDALPDKEAIEVAAEKALGEAPATVKAQIAYAGLILDHTVRMYFDFVVTDDTLTAPAVSLTVDGAPLTVDTASLTETSDGYLRATVDIKASALLKNTVTATVTDGEGNAVSRAATYSVTAYLHKFADSEDETLATLVRCIYAYAVMADDLGAGHDSEDGTPVAPTCTAAGYTPTVCTVCGYESRTAGEPAKGHGDLVQTIADDTSSITYSCADCGDKWTSEGFHYFSSTMGSKLSDGYSASNQAGYRADASTAPYFVKETEGGESYYVIRRNKETTGTPKMLVTINCAPSLSADAAGRSGVVSLRLKAPEVPMSGGWNLRLSNTAGSSWTETDEGTKNYYILYGAANGKTLKAYGNSKTVATLSTDAWTTVQIAYMTDAATDTVTLIYYVDGEEVYTTTFANVMKYNAPRQLHLQVISAISTEASVKTMYFDDLFFAYTDTARDSFLQHEHTVTDAAVTPPTCTEAGYTTYACACGEQWTDDETAPLGHADLVQTLSNDKTSVTYACSREGCTYVWTSETVRTNVSFADKTITGDGTNKEPKIEYKDATADARTMVFSMSVKGAPGAEWNLQLYNRASGGGWVSNDRYTAGTSWGLLFMQISSDGKIYAAKRDAAGNTKLSGVLGTVPAASSEDAAVSIVVTVTKDTEADTLTMCYYINGELTYTQTDHNYLINDTPGGVYSKVKVPSGTSFTIGDFFFAYNDTPRDSFLLPAED